MSFLYRPHFSQLKQVFRDGQELSLSTARRTENMCSSFSRIVGVQTRDLAVEEQHVWFWTRNIFHLCCDMYVTFGIALAIDLVFVVFFQHQNTSSQFGTMNPIYPSFECLKDGMPMGDLKGHVVGNSGRCSFLFHCWFLVTFMAFIGSLQFLVWFGSSQDLNTG